MYKAVLRGQSMSLNAYIGRRKVLKHSKIPPQETGKKEPLNSMQLEKKK